MSIFLRTRRQQSPFAVAVSALAVGATLTYLLWSGLTEAMNFSAAVRTKVGVVILDDQTPGRVAFALCGVFVVAAVGTIVLLRQVDVRIPLFIRIAVLILGIGLCLVPLRSLAWNAQDMASGGYARCHVRDQRVATKHGHRTVQAWARPGACTAAG